jgi:hypothetical protein
MLSTTCITTTPPLKLLHAHTIPTVVLHNYISRYCTINPPRACLAHVSRSGPTSSWCLTVLLHLVCLANDIDVVWTSTPRQTVCSRGSAIARRRRRLRACVACGLVNNLTRHRRANTQTADRQADTDTPPPKRAVLSFWKRASHVSQTPPGSSPSLLPFISTPGRPLCLPSAVPCHHRQKHCTLINSILALCVSSIHAPPLFQPEKHCCRHYHYRQAFWNNQRARATPPSVCKDHHQHPRFRHPDLALLKAHHDTTAPSTRHANEPTSPLPQGHYFQESPSVSSASLGPTLCASLSIPSESRLAPVGRATPAAALFLLISC